MEEGAFYVWSIDEIRDLLDSDLAELVVELYNMHPEGNYQEERTGERTGKNVLHLDRPLAEEAQARDMDEDALRQRLSTAREALYEARSERSRPGLDDKVLTDWNGLVVGALATAARVFDEPAYEKAARRTGTFLLETMHDDGGRLLHRYRDGEAGIRATLDDYAFLIWGLLELYETTYEPDWLRAARDHMTDCLDRFWDGERGGFYMTAEDGEPLIVRPKDASDGAMPSGNSVQFMNLIRLSRLTGQTAFEERADELSRWIGSSARSRPTGFTAFLSGLHWAVGSPREVVVAGDRTAPDTQSLLDVLHSIYAPTTVSLHRPPGDAPSITDLAPFTAAQPPLDGQAAAYVCSNFQCDAPTTDPEQLRKKLSRTES